jgi:hypothetical protein
MFIVKDINILLLFSLSLLAQRKETKESTLFPEVFLTEKVKTTYIFLNFSSHFYISLNRSS